MDEVLLRVLYMVVYLLLPRMILEPFHQDEVPMFLKLLIFPMGKHSHRFDHMFDLLTILHIDTSGLNNV